MRSRALRSTLAALLALAAAPGAAAGATLQVTGQVKGAGRAAVAVELLPLPGGPQPAAAPVRATAGPDGTFTLQAAAPGLYRVVVSAPGHQSIEVPLVPLVEDARLVPASLRRESEEFRPDHTERLPGDRAGPPVWVPAGRIGPAAASALRNRGERKPGAAIALAGLVVDAETRRPLPSALVWCTSCDPFGWAFTAKDGSFRFAAAPYPRYQVEAAAAGHLAGFVGDAVSTQPATLLLEPAAALAGIVVDAAGRPAAGMPVRARPSGEWDFRRSPRDASPLTASGADGRFRFPRLLPRQLYEVSVHPEENAPARLLARTPPPGGEAPPLRLVLAAGQTVVGRVVDPEGLPVAAAEVTFRRVQRPPGMSGHGFTGGGPGTSAATGADGRFRFQRLEAGEYDLQVTRQGFVATGRDNLAVSAETREVDLGDVVLEPGVVLAGRVVGPKGAPVAEAEVQVLPSDVRMFKRWSSWHESALTDADGAFRLGGLRRREPVRLAVAHPGYVRLETGEIEVPAAEPLTLELRLQGSLALRVVDPEGEPVPRAEVSAVVETRVASGQGVFSMGSSSYGLGVTDQEGKLLAQPEPGTHVLEVKAAGFETRRLPGVEVAGGETRSLEVVLRRGTDGVTLVGRVTDHAGRALPGFHVQAVPDLKGAEAEGLHPLRQDGFTETDADGSYRLEALRPGRYEVEARGGRQRMARAAVRLTAGTERLDLVVAAGTEVSGHIVDAAGRPVGGAVARLHMITGGEAFHATSAADGSFAFDWVPEGTYRLLAEARGYARADAPGEVQVAGTAVGGLEVRLEERGGAISGQVLGLDPAERPRIHVRALRLDDSAGFSRVGPDGRYRIADLAPGDWQVVATTHDGRQASGEVTLEPGQAEAYLDLELETRPVLTGRVTFDGRPLAGADVRLHGPSAPGTRTAQDGSFRVGVTPGRYTLILLEQRQGFGYSRSVEVGPDGAEVTIDLEGASLSGRVLDAGGVPIAGAALAVEGINPALDVSYSGPSARTDDAGLFALRLAPGHYRLTVSADGFAPATTDVELPEGRTVELEVPLAPAAETAEDTGAEDST
jgi:protocatechuate 3,4-dioxygenase beta subunit